MGIASDDGVQLLERAGQQPDAAGWRLPSGRSLEEFGLRAGFLSAPLVAGLLAPQRRRSRGR